MTRVNGEVRQQTGTDDMYWSVKQIIHHLTQGTTPRVGTVIMTETPSGVGHFQKKYLKEGDVVEVEIEGFEKAPECSQVRIDRRDGMESWTTLATVKVLVVESK